MTSGDELPLSGNPIYALGVDWRHSIVLPSIVHHANSAKAALRRQLTGCFAIAAAELAARHAAAVSNDAIPCMQYGVGWCVLSLLVRL